MSISDDVGFVPGDPARTSQIVLWGGASASGDAVDALLPTGEGVAVRTMPARRLGIAEAIPLLLQAYRSESGRASAAWWGAATALALDLIGRGRLLPRFAVDDVDEWRVGPLDAEDVERIEQLVSSMPPSARAIGSDGGRIPNARSLLRRYLDACADVLPRDEPTAGEPAAPYATTLVVRRPELREWADELDTGLRLVLRVDATSDEFADLSVTPCCYRADDPSQLVEAAALWNSAHDFGPRAQADAVLAIRAAARVWRPLGRLLDLSVPDRIELSDDETGDLVGLGGRRLATAGFELRWPRELVTDVRVAARIDRHSNGAASLGSGRLFDLRWQVAVGGRVMTERELDQLAQASRPVVRLRDRWVVVPGEVIARVRERAVTPVSGIDAVSAALTGRIEADAGWADVVAGPDLARLRDRLVRQEDGDEPLEQPAELVATLRDYQLRGLRWLDRMTSLGLGCCLADDMGLGKTITVIALHLHRKANGQARPTLVVCPATLLGNWEREIERFAPGTPVHRFHGAGRSLDEVADGFVLTTYGTMRRDAERLAGIAWGQVIADEAQHVKNRASSTATELRRIDSGMRIALTGTPVENSLHELWAILDWAVPGLLGTPRQFAERYAEPIQAERDPDVAARLRRLVAPFLLRRHKTDPGIAPELPAKTETDQFVSLTDEQIGLYEAAVREGLRDVSAGESAFDRRGRIFAMLTALKQICNHPAQYLREEDPLLAGRSGKLALLDELLDTIRSEDGATLIFTQYVAMARLLRRHLSERGVPSLQLDGSTPVGRRQELVDAFQRGDTPVFVLSLKAAGTGLNLTRADHVVHYDRWWNPAVEDQATDRAYRIGQTRSVQVHRLVAEGTIEDRIAAVLRSKRRLADAVLASGEAALSELSDAELEELVSLRSPK